MFAGAVRRRIHADQGVHLHAARRAAADAIRTAALCERRWRAAQAHAAAADAARRESEELLGRERRGVVHACRNAFDAMRRDAERRETTLVRTASRLDEHAARLRKASDRVACAAELVRQREVRVRNARAALAAEKRLWRRERRDAETKALAEGGVAVTAPPPDALVGLRPEAEALMRGIFRDLDADATGSVPAAALRKALRGDDRLDRLMRNYCGPDAWADCLDALDRRLTALHAKPWGVSDCANEADRPFASTEDVTWGEVAVLRARAAAGRVRRPSRGARVPAEFVVDCFPAAAFAGRARVTFVGTGSGRADAAAAPSGSQPVDGRPGRAAARPRARGPRRGAPPRRRRVAVAPRTAVAVAPRRRGAARRGLDEGGARRGPRRDQGRAGPRRGRRRRRAHERGPGRGALRRASQGAAGRPPGRSGRR